MATSARTVWSEILDAALARLSGEALFRLAHPASKAKMHIQTIRRL